MVDGIHEMQVDTVSDPASHTRRPWDRLRGSRSLRSSGLLAALALLVIVFTVLYPAFLSIQNVLNILLATATLGIAAMGQSFVIATAGIDLSVGSIAAFAGIVCAMGMGAGLPVSVCIVLGVVVGGLAGLVNGLVIVLTHITPFMVTLGTMSIFSGLALLVNNGQPIYNLPSQFTDFFNAELWGIPVPVIFLALITIFLSLVLRKTVIGEFALSIGGNTEASRLAGVNVPAYTTLVYVVSGLCAGFAGVIIAGRLGTADPNAGSDLLLDCIAAAVMGGASLLGGEASAVGAVIGAIVITALQTGLTLIGVAVFWQVIAVGAVVIVAVGLDQYSKRRRA